MNINELIVRAHNNAVNKGFYECPECFGTGKKCTIECDHNKPTDCTGKKQCGEYIGVTCSSCNGTGKVQRNIGELLMLIVSELGEALEAHRKNKHASFKGFDNWVDGFAYGDQMPDGFKTYIKDTFEDELADVFIRLFDFCGYMKIQPVDFPHGVTISENVGEGLLEITHMICRLHSHINIFGKDSTVSHYILQDIFDHLLLFCNMHKIDIEKHIELKMRYNETREYKHGKNY